MSKQSYEKNVQHNKEKSELDIIWCLSRAAKGMKLI